MRESLSALAESRSASHSASLTRGRTGSVALPARVSTASIASQPFHVGEERRWAAGGAQQHSRGSLRQTHVCGESDHRKPLTVRARRPALGARPHHESQACSKSQLLNDPPVFDFTIPFTFVLYPSITAGKNGMM